MTHLMTPAEGERCEVEGLDASAKLLEWTNQFERMTVHPAVPDNCKVRPGDQQTPLTQWLKRAGKSATDYGHKDVKAFMASLRTMAAKHPSSDPRLAVLLPQYYLVRHMGGLDGTDKLYEARLADTTLVLRYIKSRESNGHGAAQMALATLQTLLVAYPQRPFYTVLAEACVSDEALTKLCKDTPRLDRDGVKGLVKFLDKIHSEMEVLVNPANLSSLKEEAELVYGDAVDRLLAEVPANPDLQASLEDIPRVCPRCITKGGKPSIDGESRSSMNLRKQRVESISLSCSNCNGSWSLRSGVRRLEKAVIHYKTGIHVELEQALKCYWQLASLDHFDEVLAQAAVALEYLRWSKAPESPVEYSDMRATVRFLLIHHAESLNKLPRLMGPGKPLDIALSHYVCTDAKRQRISLTVEKLEAEFFKGGAELLPLPTTVEVVATEEVEVPVKVDVPVEVEVPAVPPAAPPVGSTDQLLTLLEQQLRVEIEQKVAQEYAEQVATLEEQNLELKQQNAEKDALIEQQNAEIADHKTARELQLATNRGLEDRLSEKEKLCDQHEATLRQIGRLASQHEDTDDE